MLIRDERIVELTASRTVSATEVDLGGNYLAPGFIDLHVHGGAGYDASAGTAGAFRKICEFHATGGTTALLLTTATAPLASILDVLQSVRAVMREFPQIVGAHVEGPFISRAKPGAQRAEFIQDPSAAATDELLAFADVVKRVTMAPELPGALEMIAALANGGIAVSGGHSDAWDEEARAGYVAGMRHTTHTFNCMSSMRRRGVERVAGLLEFALSEPRITCELIADGHHVTPTLMKMLYRAKGADGICLVTDATAGAGLPEGETFQLAGRACVVAGGACWLADRSALAGSAARMIDCVRTMVRDVGAPLTDTITMATATPARAAGLTSKGRLEAGADADLVVFSDEFEIKQTIVGGVTVYRGP